MYAHLAVIYRKRKALKQIEEKPTCKIQSVTTQTFTPTTETPCAEVAPTTMSGSVMRTHPTPREWPTRDRGRERQHEFRRPHSTSSFCICPADFTSRGMCVCGRGREFANTNRASAMSFGSYKEPPTRDRDLDTESPSPRESESNPEVEEPEQMATEVKVKVEGENGEPSETDTLQSKRGLRRRHRTYFFTNDGINVFLRAGMIGKQIFFVIQYFISCFNILSYLKQSLIQNDIPYTQHLVWEVWFWMASDWFSSLRLSPLGNAMERCLSFTHP